MRTIHSPIFQDLDNSADKSIGLSVDAKSVSATESILETLPTESEEGSALANDSRKRKDAPSAEEVGGVVEDASGEKDGEGSDETLSKRIRREKPKKAKTMLSAELYRSMTAMIALILKTKVRADIYTFY